METLKCIDLIQQINQRNAHRGITCTIPIGYSEPPLFGIPIIDDRLERLYVNRFELYTHSDHIDLVSRRFRAAQWWARQHGYVAAFPTFCDTEDSIELVLFPEGTAKIDYISPNKLNSVNFNDQTLLAAFRAINICVKPISFPTFNTDVISRHYEIVKYLPKK